MRTDGRSEGMREGIGGGIGEMTGGMDTDRERDRENGKETGIGTRIGKGIEEEVIVMIGEGDRIPNKLFDLEGKYGSSGMFKYVFQGRDASILKHDDYH